MAKTTIKHCLAGWDRGYTYEPLMSVHQHKTFHSPVSLPKSLKKSNPVAWLLKSECNACCLFAKSQNHRSWKRPPDINESNPLLKQDSDSRSHRKACRWVLNLCREGHSTTSLDKLLQCSIALAIKKLFCMFVWNFQCSSFFAHCPLFCLCTSLKIPWPRLLDIFH